MRRCLGIGILAHNEERSIGLLLECLARQCILDDRGLRAITVVTLVNGSQDRTAEVAISCCRAIATALAGGYGASEQGPLSYDDGESSWTMTVPSRDGRPAIQFVVWDTAVTGKSRAWNRCVHEILPAECDMICMLDADIWFDDPRLIKKTLVAIESDPQALVAVGEPRHGARPGTRKTLIQRLAAHVSRSEPRSPAIAGSLYLAHGAALRAIVMPPGLPVEDGFLHAMVRTDLFRSRSDLPVVVRAEGAQYYFEACRTLSELLRHEARLAVGTVLNSYLFAELWAEARAAGASAYIRARLLDDPQWYAGLMESRAAGRRWHIPRSMLFRRFRRLRRLTWWGRLARLPLALLATAFDWTAFLKANRILRQGRGVAYW